MRWMDVAWAEVGTCEIEGPAACPAIIGYFRDAGRADVTSDETHWCAAFVGACLARASVPLDLPVDQRLRARAYLEVGTPIAEPRVGCIAVFERGKDGWSGHVGFVTGWTATHIKVLGGNQADAVNERWFPRDSLLKGGLRWPEPPVSPGDLKAAGSRTVERTDRAWWDGIKSFIWEGSSQAAGDASAVQEATKAVTEGRQIAGAVVDFAQFFLAKWPWIASLVALYFLARMLWHLGWIRFSRADDHNTGRNTGRDVIKVPADV